MIVGVSARAVLSFSRSLETWSIASHHLALCCARRAVYIMHCAIHDTLRISTRLSDRSQGLLDASCYFLRSFFSRAGGPSSCFPPSEGQASCSLLLCSSLFVVVGVRCRRSPIRRFAWLWGARRTAVRRLGPSLARTVRPIRYKVLCILYASRGK